MTILTLAGETRSFGGAHQALNDRASSEERFAPGAVIEEAHDERPGLRRVLAGWLGLCLTLSDGRRQILQLMLPGDVCSLAALAPGPGPYAVVAFSTATVGDVAAPSEGDVPRRPDQRLLLDHIVRLGKLSALERTANLFIELYERSQRAGLTQGLDMPMPLTQETLADHLGVSVVHMNRVLKQLRSEGLIIQRRGKVTFRDLAGLALLGHREPPVANADTRTFYVDRRPPSLVARATASSPTLDATA